MGKLKKKEFLILRKKENKGITLIALVVTIIVLLILAGVSISMLTGENGILKRANEAKEETARATENEQRKMAMLEAAMNTELTYFQDVPIPSGFAPTRMPGESTVDEGLVITDSEGNEFVWIPCEYSETEKNGNENAVIYNTDNGETEDHRDSTWIAKQWRYNGGTWYDSQPKKVGEGSIKKNHGFYVARYEAGVPEDAPFYASKEGDTYYDDEGVEYAEKEIIKKEVDETKAKNTSKYIPVSKKGNQVWDCISQPNAKTVSENMINTADVKSYLIDSHAWNTICRLIQKKCNSTNDVLKSIAWGNYEDNNTTKYEKLKGLYVKRMGDVFSRYSRGTIPNKTTLKENEYLELSTGICEEFKAYNIYDLAGNLFEWTTEVGNKGETITWDNENTKCVEGECENAKNAVRRGGSYYDKGDDNPVVMSNGDSSIDDCSSGWGFRVVLYLK